MRQLFACQASSGSIECISGGGFFPDSDTLSDSLIGLTRPATNSAPTKSRRASAPAVAICGPCRWMPAIRSGPNQASLRCSCKAKARQSRPGRFSLPTAATLLTTRMRREVRGRCQAPVGAGWQTRAREMAGLHRRRRMAGMVDQWARTLLSRPGPAHPYRGLHRNLRCFLYRQTRAWSDRQIRWVGPFKNFVLAPDGKPFAVCPLPDASAQDQGTAHVTFLLNFTDELRRKVLRSM
jgi:hypothetical protein